MYESHFGFSSLPFQLNPDPDFYFDSRGHANALSYLKFGVFQGEGFIVVTGEVGAGKTTLVRTLLNVLNAEQVVAAQIVSTQLGSADLLRAILSAFGVASTGAGKADMIMALETFLTALATQGKRALLIVDEAQNLSLEAVEELRMLSNFQFGNRGLLQSFLIGQPELRTMLQSNAMLQFRQRVIASCHLGPLEEAETRAYVEHRLRRAGWNGLRPDFAEEAYRHIHAHAGGVPRRINNLCSRLLLSCYLSGDDKISASRVDLVAAELMSELGEVQFGSEPRAGAWAVAPSPSAARQGIASSIAKDDVAKVSPLLLQIGELGNAIAAGAVLMISDSPAGRLKISALAAYFAARWRTDKLLHLHLRAETDSDHEGKLPSALRSKVPELDYRLPDLSYDRLLAQVVPDFTALVAQTKPTLVISLGQTDSQALLVNLAFRAASRVIRLEAGQRRNDVVSASAMNARVLDLHADVLFTNKLTAHYSLHREGIPADKCFNSGSLLSDVLGRIGDQRANTKGVMAAHDLPAAKLFSTGYALCIVRIGANAIASDHGAAAVGVIHAISAKIPVIWMTDEPTAAFLEQQTDLIPQVRGIYAIPTVEYQDAVSLLQHARLLISDQRLFFVEEAALLRCGQVIVGDASDVHDAEETRGGFIGFDGHRALRRVGEILNASAEPVEPDPYDSEEVSRRIAERLGGLLSKALKTPVLKSVN